MNNRCAYWVVWACVTVAIGFGCSRNSNDAHDAAADEAWDVELPVDVVRSEGDPEEAGLQLTLKPGDRFPLRKVVHQELVQDAQTGTRNRIESRLEVLFAISVLDKVEDRTKLGVRYDRVRYLRRIGDEQLTYDSGQSSASLPVSLWPYRDMVGDGFTFWLGADNQIVAIDGFTEFMNRCLKNVPEEDRNQVVLGMEASTGESGIANFIDNTIGLLPYGTSQKLGDSWERPSHIGRPVPMHVRNRYTLTELDKEVAKIDIRGEITPSTTMNAANEETGVRVVVTGGESQGHCTIFRETGLPKHSEVTQHIEMTVMLSNNVQFKQHKQVTTTIEAFPAQTATAPTIITFGETAPRPIDAPRPDAAIRPASAP